MEFLLDFFLSLSLWSPCIKIRKKIRTKIRTEKSHRKIRTEKSAPKNPHRKIRTEKSAPKISAPKNPRQKSAHKNPHSAHKTPHTKSLCTKIRSSFIITSSSSRLNHDTRKGRQTTHRDTLKYFFPSAANTHF